MKPPESEAAMAEPSEADRTRVRLLLRQGTDVEGRLARLIAYERALAIKEARASAEGKWIATSERMPENGARVLGIHPPSGHVYIYCLDYGQWETDDDTQIRQPEFHPRFWMPLPPAPKASGR